MGGTYRMKRQTREKSNLQSTSGYQIQREMDSKLSKAVKKT